MLRYILTPVVEGFRRIPGFSLLKQNPWVNNRQINKSILLSGYSGMTQPEKNTETAEITKIFHGSENVVKKVSQFIQTQNLDLMLV